MEREYPDLIGKVIRRVVCKDAPEVAGFSDIEGWWREITIEFEDGTYLSYHIKWCFLEETYGRK